jgi:uncharacterized membrane protein YccC
MSLNRRLACLERNAQDKENPELTQRMRGEEERLRAHASPEAVARHDAAAERMTAAYEAADAANPNPGTAVPDTEELGAACDEYLDALEYLENARKEG